MTWMQKMDAVLVCLYDHSGENPSFADLQKWIDAKYVRKVDKGEIEDITLYLWREDMMYCERGGKRRAEYDDTDLTAHYLISCKGKLFWENDGGFQEQYRKETTQKRLLSLEKWLIVGGTVAAGLYGLIEVTKFLSKLFSCSFC